MSKNTRKNQEIRLLKVSEMYMQGFSQRAIAEVVGVTQQQVSSDMKKLVQRWKEEAISNITEAKIMELRRIDELQSICWGQFQLSKEPVVTITKSKKRVNLTGIRKDTNEGIEIPATEETEKISTRTPTTGNPKWIEKVQWCINKRCQILGLDSPLKLEVKGNYDYSQATTEELKTLASIMGRLKNPTKA